MSEVNFVRDRRKSLNKQQKLDKIMLRYAQYGFAGVLGVFLVVMGARLVLNRSLQTIVEAQDRARSSIVGSENIERSFVLAINKLNVLNELFLERQNKQDAIDYFSRIFGNDVLIKQIEYNAGGGILTFGLQSKNVFVLERVLVQLENVQEESLFSQANPSDLRRNEEGKYEMKVTITLATEGEVTGQESGS